MPAGAFARLEIAFRGLAVAVLARQVLAREPSSKDLGPRDHGGGPLDDIPRPRGTEVFYILDEYRNVELRLQELLFTLVRLGGHRMRDPDRRGAILLRQRTRQAPPPPCPPQ
eukprot:8940478-Pyramimonas_sp.AAC.1